MDPYILVHINIVCPDVRYTKLKTGISELILDSYEIHTSSIHNNGVHNLTLMKMIVARFVVKEVSKLSYEINI